MKKNTGKKKSSAERFAGKGIFPHKLAFTLLIPLRNIFLSPKKLIQRLEINEESVVLEVGSGPGYSCIKVAESIPKGKLLLTDIQQKMLDYAERRIDRKGLQNVEYYLCNGRTFPFSDNTFDRIFMVTVIGEVENKEEYVKEFYRILKDDGIMSISELAGDPDKMEIDKVKELAGKSGFKIYRVYGSRKNYTINFKK